MNPTASAAPMLDPRVSEVTTAPAQENPEVSPRAFSQPAAAPEALIRATDEARSMLRSTLAELL